MKQLKFTDFYQTSKELIYISAPSMIQLLIVSSYTTIIFYNIAQLKDEQKTAAVGFANFIINVICIQLFFAINQAFLTKISYAYGIKDISKMQIFLIQTLTINLSVFVIFYLFILKIEMLCGLLGFSDQMIIYVKEYLSIGIVGGFFFGMFDTVRQYLYVQQIYYVPLYINLLTMVVCLVMSRFIIGSGIQVAAYHLVLVHLTNLVLIVAYSFYKKKVSLDQIKNISDVMEGIQSYSIFTIKITLITYSDQLSFEIMTLIVCTLDEVSLATHVSLVQFYELFAAFPISLHVALTNQTAFYYSQRNNPASLNKLKSIIIYSIFLVPIYNIISILLINTTSNQWIYIYTQSPQVILQLQSMIPIICLLMLFDFSAVTSQGILKGTMQEVKAIFIIVICYYLLMVPLSLYLKSYFGLQGVWTALLLSAVLVMLTQFLVLYKTDYQIKSQSQLDYEMTNLCPIKKNELTNSNNQQPLINKQNLEYQ